MSRYISYQSILKDRELFRKSGTISGGDFNLTDTPGTKYFKIMFYFNNGDVNGEENTNQSTGLLSPTWLLSGVEDSTYYKYNSAWSYLKMNCEDERADMLVQFVNLLSNISSQSPWYFSELSGLDQALERKQIMDKNFQFDEERKKISIKCLPDAYDDRIATLLDLYRSIVWSWSMKREVVPSNLRKFDMGIFIFDTPVIPFNSRPQDGVNTYSEIGESYNYKTSYKYIEFHNCEFDYNSNKGLSAINNQEGTQPEYTIDILFDDCYEERYNEFLTTTLGDMIYWDTLTVDNIDLIDSNIDFPFGGDEFMDYYKHQERIEPDHKELTANKVTKTLPKTGFLTSVASELVGHAEEFVKSKINKVVLGNLYNFSLSQSVSQVKQALSGHVFSTANAIKSYTSDDKKVQVKYVNKIGNIYQNQTIANNI